MADDVQLNSDTDNVDSIGTDSSIVNTLANPSAQGGSSSPLAQSLSPAPPTLGTEAQLQAPANEAAAQAPAAPQGDGSSANPIIMPPRTADNTSFNPPPQPKSRLQQVLQAVVVGGMTGIGGAAGAKSFGAGLAGGVNRELAVQQQNKENVVQQQQLQFESVKAADSHIAALNSAKVSDQEQEGNRIKLGEAGAEYDKLMKDYGMNPAVTISGADPSGNHAQATGALTTLAKGNDTAPGKIPQIAVSNHPQSANDPTHTTNVYSPTIANMGDDNAKKRAFVDDFLATQGRPPNSDAQWNSAGADIRTTLANQRQMVMDAQKGLMVPSVSDKPAENAATSANLQQQIDNYKGSASPNAQTSKMLQARLDAFNAQSLSQQEKVVAAKNLETAGTAQAEAAAAAQKAAAIEKASLPYKQAQARFEQTLKDGDPTSAGQLLAKGLVAPSQIISARNPAFAQQAFKAANDYSMQTTGKPFNAQVQEGYFKAAESSTNVNFFGSAKSLTDNGGTLDQLQQAGNSVSQSEFDILNKAKNWGALHTGEGGISAYGSTAIGVADDYSKVMGGGQGSDASRQMILDSINPARSPEQRAASVNAMRQAVDSQMGGRLGTNPVMKGMYGDQMLVRVNAGGKSYTFRDQQAADSFKAKAQQSGVQVQ